MNVKIITLSQVEKRIWRSLYTSQAADLYNECVSEGPRAGGREPLLIAVADHIRLVGVLYATENDSELYGTAYWIDVAVAAEARGQGVGSRLFERAESMLSGHIVVFPTTNAGEKLARKMGYAASDPEGDPEEVEWIKTSTHGSA